MLRVHKPKALGVAGLLAVFAMALVAAFGAVPAQANGPWWIRGAAKELLLEGESRTVDGENDEVSMELLSNLANIVCLLLVVSGTALGGTPGTDLEELEFKECSLAGRTVAECGAASAGMNPGIILVEVLTVLAYPHGKFETDPEAYDLVFPDGNETLFVTFTLSGTNCGILNNHTVDVLATGTKVIEAKLEAFNSKCGVIGVLGLLNAAKAFEDAVSGEVFEVGAINYPSPAITLAEMLALTEATQTEEVQVLVTCGLEVIDKNTNIKATGTQDGVVLVEALAGGVKEPFGWAL